MRCILFCYCFILSCLQLVNAQQVELQFHLIDGATEKSISEISETGNRIGLEADPLDCQSDLTVVGSLKETGFHRLSVSCGTGG